MDRTTILAIIFLVCIGSFLGAYFLTRNRDTDSSRDTKEKCTAFKGDGKSCRKWADGACYKGTVKDGSCVKEVDWLGLSLIILSGVCFLGLLVIGGMKLFGRGSSNYDSSTLDLS